MARGFDTFGRFRRSRPALAGVALIGLVAAGYASAAATAPACERATDRWLDGRLARAFWKYPVRRTSEPAEYRLPWLVAVRYEIVEGNTGGEWGTRYYLALPGLPVPIRERIEQQS